MNNPEKHILIPTNPQEQFKGVEQLGYLISLAHHSHRLEEFFSNFVGDTADWPVKIICDDPELNYRLNELLINFRQSLKPFRKEHLNQDRGGYIVDPTDGSVQPYPGPLFRPPENNN